MTRSFRVDFEGSFPTVGQMPSGDLPEVAFAGRSNVGKSSCINALLNRRKAARVSRRPGRTQMLNLFRIDDRLRFVDLPGYGYAAAPEAVRRKWGPMVEGYLRQRTALQMLVLLLDIRREPSDEDQMLARFLAERELPTLVVLTKVDKVKRNQRMKRIKAITGGGWIAGPPVVQFSAPKREGVEAVWGYLDGLAP